ncbi:MAG TPA: PAS domain S-box protein [Novimethylophilus sp.]|jgi:PAS domain S-box-containing protein|uniref:sensor histidine kinase n=1 Tax=Novimethylophilus sp. TaxID=2137426 RepID=UPI002F427BC3
MTVLTGNESLAQGLLEAAPDAVVIVDEAGTIILVNAQTEQLFGYGREELVGKPVEILIPAALKRQHIHHRDTFIAAPKTRPMGMGRDLSGMRKDGSLVPVEVSLSPMQTDEGRIVISIIRDATKSKRVEREMRGLNTRLKQHMQELVASNQELESFCYSVSHDLRAPLRSLDGFSLALIEDYADIMDDTGKDYLRRVRASSQQMSQLIDGLLKLSRITRTELHRQALNLSAIARKTLQQLLKSDPGRDVTINVMDGMQGYGDPDLIAIALGNLLGNAFKFSSKTPDPVIEMSMQEQAGSTVFCVRDNGAGFDMAYAEKLFGAFQRLHTAAEFEGTGIGLATVQRVINRHGGKIWAEGQVGHGAAFFFTLENIP